MSRRDYLSLYLEEARELWAEGETALETDTDAAKDAFMRVAHTLKGMSGTMGYKGLSETFHQLENIGAAWERRTEVGSVWADVGAALDNAAAQGSDRPLKGFQAPDPGGAGGAGAPSAPASAMPPEHTATATQPASAVPPTGQWYCLTTARDEPMPRARILQWHRSLRRAGVPELWPGEQEIQSNPDLSGALYARIEGNDQMAHARKLPNLDHLEPGAPPSPEGDEPAPGTPLLRVDLRLMDSLFDEIGQLHTHLRILGTTPYGSADWEREMRDVQALVTRSVHRAASLRMSSLAPLMDLFARSAEQAAERSGKAVEVVREGEGLRIAREVVERLRPLLPHMARNAVAHGIEDPATRAAAGKPEHGTIRFRARQEGTRVILSIEDDGGGVDTDVLRRKAEQAGFVLDEAVDEEALLRFLFMPGLSTKEAADDMAGRGVGLDAVKEAVEHAGGRVRVRQKLGAYFRLDLEIPVPLALQQVMQIEAGDVPVGILDEGWEPWPGSDPPPGRWVQVPGLKNDGDQILRAGDRILRVQGYRHLGNVYMHHLRPPLDRIPGAIGFYLDTGGAPRLLFKVEPAGSAA